MSNSHEFDRNLSLSSDDLPLSETFDNARKQQAQVDPVGLVTVKVRPLMHI